METANLTKANQARKNKALDKLYRFSDHGVTSFRKLIDKGVFIKATHEKVPQLKYNRAKFNRMTDEREQDEYYRKCTEKTKSAYFLYYDERTSTETSKFVYQYYLETQN